LTVHVGYGSHKYKKDYPGRYPFVAKYDKSKAKVRFTMVADHSSKAQIETHVIQLR